MEKNSNPYVDILLATYDTKIDYLKNQIDSILNQTYKNINLIISDDHSTKREVIDVLKEYEGKDNRIKLYLQEENLGGYLKNFEFLLSNSTAEYIAFSDHDDIWYPEKIEKSLKNLIDNDLDLVYTDANQVDQNGQVLQESYLRYKNMPIINGKNNILAFSRHIAIGCSQVFTKKIKDQMIPFKDSTMAHDWISLYLASKQNGVGCIDESLFGYRIHETNAFGGRNLEQNLNKWKTEEENKNNYKSYKSYMRYRDKVILDAYLKGAYMCKEKSDELVMDENEEESDIIKYYEKLRNCKFVNFKICKYFKYLYFKGIGKRFAKELILFHFPLFSYPIYLYVSK